MREALKQIAAMTDEDTLDPAWVRVARAALEKGDNEIERLREALARIVTTPDNTGDTLRWIAAEALKDG